VTAKWETTLTHRRLQGLGSKKQIKFEIVSSGTWLGAIPSAPAEACDGEMGNYPHPSLNTNYFNVHMSCRPRTSRGKVGT